MHATILLIALWSLAAALASAASPATSMYVTEARSFLQVLASNGLRVEFLGSITNLPASVKERLPEVADSGDPHIPGCIGGSPRQRFVVATKTGGTYNIAIEQGGLATTWFIRQFVVFPNGKISRETRIEPPRPANRSQTFPPATNSTSQAAGSRR